MLLRLRDSQRKPIEEARAERSIADEHLDRRCR
jgi:hypothetical protein